MLLELPSTFRRPDSNDAGEEIEIASDWLEASVLFSGEAATAPVVTDLLVESQWFQAQPDARAFVDEVEASWIGFLLHFDLARQRELLARLGLDDVIFRILPALLFFVLVLLLSVFYFFETRRREPLSPDEKLYRQLLRQLKRWNVQKSAEEGPLTLMAKAEAIHPKLAEELSPILETLILVRFGGRQLSAQALETLKKQMQGLKKLSINLSGH